MNKRHDFAKLERESVTSQISLRALCRHQCITAHSLVTAQAKKHKWAEKREQYEAKESEESGSATRHGWPTVEAIGDGMERWAWDCPTGAEVELVVHGGGHEWPSGAPVSINERIWEFFEQHPMP